MNNTSPVRESELDGERISDWLHGNPSSTALLNALSLMLPAGERFFSTSVEKFKDRVADPITRAEVDELAAEDTRHADAQASYNRALASLDAEALQADLQTHVVEVQARATNLECLARTAAFEHLTSILSTELLANPAVLRGASPAYAGLWRWHARHEVEQRAVAFDLLGIATHGKALWLRRRTMVAATIVFLRFMLKNVSALFAAQPAAGKRGSWLGLVWFTFGSPGLFRKLITPYFRYFARDFHPNEEAAAESPAFSSPVFETAV